MTHEDFIEGYQVGRLDATFSRRVSREILDKLVRDDVEGDVPNPLDKYVRMYRRVTWVGGLVRIATPILFILTGLYLSWWLVPWAVVPLIAIGRIRDRIKDKAMAEMVMGNRGVYDSLMQRSQMRVVERQK